jgi:phosphoribosylformimino-5-aminoimidazole carboxamide ribotide isomerase
MVEDLNDFPLAAVMVTAVHVEGLLQGPDTRLMEDIVEVSTHPVYSSGGIRGMNDLESLAEEGVAAAIVGMAIYTGALDARAAAEEFQA